MLNSVKDIIDIIRSELQTRGCKFTDDKAMLVCDTWDGERIAKSIETSLIRNNIVGFVKSSNVVLSPGNGQDSIIQFRLENITITIEEAELTVKVYCDVY